MLSKILSKRECAECKICCSFDSYDLLETPVVTDEIMQRSLAVKPDQRFADVDGTRLYIMDKEPDRDLYYCPMLDHSKGCLLGDSKPFDCRIWPFKIMRFEGRRVIALSPVCPIVSDKPLSELRELAHELAPVIFAEADREPSLVRPYSSGYTIMLAEDVPKLSAGR
jgi:Fe-S-cluster containining protein